MSSSDEIHVGREALSEGATWLVGGGLTVYFGWNYPENHIYCGLCFAVTLNILFLLNRKLPIDDGRNDKVNSRAELAKHMKKSALASVRSQYRFLALMGDVALVYFIVHHFFLRS